MKAKLTIETFPDGAAAAYVRGKAAADPENFGRLPAQLKQRAFAVAGVEQMDALRRIRDAVAGLPEGAAWDEAKREVAAEMSPYTGGDMKAARARAEFLLRTHGFQAFAVSRHQQQRASARLLPYWQYETVGDARVRPGHRALDGKVLRADDPWWKTHYPPWDWGCRCVVNALDEEDALEIGVTDGSRMPAPGRGEGFSFDPSDASLGLDALRGGRDDADWRLFVNGAKSATVHPDGRAPETMWELMLDQKMQRTARTVASETQSDGRERAVVLDFQTGKKIGDFTGNASSVRAEVPDNATVCTLHTHPKGDNTPSPADLRFGFLIGSKADYIAAGKRLRRWQWLKTPEKEDARRIMEFDADNNAGRIDIDEYESFLGRLVSNGYIRMEELS